MINLIIWSKDRAAQLFLLLESLARFAPNIFGVNIIYKASTAEFAKGYEELWDKRSLLPLMLVEKDFYKDTYREVAIGLQDFVSFATDDCVLYRPIHFTILKDALPEHNNQVFSLRLGYNTVVQNIHTGQMQPPLNVHIEHENYLSWNPAFYNPHDNYGYPFGLDLHVFRKSLILPILDEIEFHSTNELESKLTTNYRHMVDEIRSFKQSVAVNIPINTTNGVTRAGEQHGISKEELNQRFLDGWKIDLEKISKEDVKSCHKEIAFSWIKI
jgi:hypothetical protein